MFLIKNSTYVEDLFHFCFKLLIALLKMVFIKTFKVGILDLFVFLREELIFYHMYTQGMQTIETSDLDIPQSSWCKLQKSEHIKNI
jgi:hypothetical protein